MARREIITRGSNDTQFEIVGRARRALQQTFEVDSARAMPRNLAPLDVGSVYRLHSSGVSAGVCAASRITIPYAGWCSLKMVPQAVIASRTPSATRPAFTVARNRST